MAPSTRLYTLLAFVTGVIMTLGYKDVYPDLERRFRRRRRRTAMEDSVVSHRVGDELKIQGDDIRLVREEYPLSKELEYGGFPEQGIEACIGKTPLFKIKSLSKETGCEILAKAEVCSSRISLDSWTVHLR